MFCVDIAYFLRNYRKRGQDNVIWINDVLLSDIMGIS